MTQYLELVFSGTGYLVFTSVITALSYPCLRCAFGGREMEGQEKKDPLACRVVSGAVGIGEIAAGLGISALMVGKYLN